MARSVSCIVAIALFLCGTCHGRVEQTQDICKDYDGTPQTTITCYGGTFLVKMLSELNSGESKTVEHVKSNLLPYLGGPDALNALEHKDQKKGLTDLRNTVPPDVVKTYDSLKVCHVELTDRILDAIPQKEVNGQMTLIPAPKYHSNAFQQTMSIFDTLMQDKAYDERSCALVKHEL
ncbi:unnamed protein product [Vitrella brassicaformis CCMP3155]|uniref:Uncharacterized protein n=2 Tax=Vitrella brassicaformis TaxID=1169539 RepID=A0A0G4ECS2_VITBC|nr:unnamed protein product [Vitrella brassicaformis CCMP3155]|mmetsp:Transcript_35453/g.88118  ORF Transcript_35453/g.88118 Transcript_35453/m.88118 type:complete len:177 (+) Transcript_35453:80-610(+)|eukprot:CEL93111.1 unnamed protein product [Vitrella brassicaformis CCMP3155]